MGCNNRYVSWPGLLAWKLILFLFLTAGPLYADARVTGALLTDESGTVLFESNSTRPFIPASVLKLLTSLAAMDVLGKDHRFATQVYFDPASLTLYLKGFGDPLFISEVIQALVDQILDVYSIRRIDRIVLDQSYFANNIRVPGKGESVNPYDAGVGALCANFNTIVFRQAADGSFISDEPQTPLLPVFLDDIKKTGLSNGRIPLSKKQSRVYPGQLIQYFLDKKNISVSGHVALGPFPPVSDPVTFYSPFPLSSIIRNLLKYSNNFIANQLVLAMGAKRYGPGADLEAGLNVMRDYADKKLRLRDLQIFEGSGISRQNRLSPCQMIRILKAFLPYENLLNQSGRDHYKTGTLTGVRTRAGYFTGKDKKKYPYVIMINQRKKGYDTIYKKMIAIIQEKEAAIPTTGR